MGLPFVYAVGAAVVGAAGVSAPIPAGTVADDVLILLLENDATLDPAYGAVTGYTEVLNSPVAQTGGLPTRLTARWHRATGPESGTVSVPDGGNHTVAQIIGVRGCTTSGNPWNVTASGLDSTAGTSLTLPTLTTTADNCLILQAFSTGQDVASTANASGWTNGLLANIAEQADIWTSNGTGGGLAAAVGEKAVKGSIGSTTATVGAGNFKAMLSIALQPGSDGGMQYLPVMPPPMDPPPMPLWVQFLRPWWDYSGTVEDPPTGWVGGASTDSGGASVLTLTLTDPGVPTGSLGVLLVGYAVSAANETVTITADSGGGTTPWTATLTPVGANNEGFAVLHRIKGASDTTTITITLAASRITCAEVGWWSGKSGVGAVGTLGNRAGTSSTTITAAGVSTATGRVVAQLFIERTANAGTTASLDQGNIRLYREDGSAGACSVLIGDLLAAGSTTASTTATYTDASGNAVGVQVELLPAPSVRGMVRYQTVASAETSVVMPLPPGWQVGDAHLVFASSRASGGGFTTTPTGWTAVQASFDSLSSTSSHMVCYGRLLQAGDADPTLSFASGRMAAVSLAVRDHGLSVIGDLVVANDPNGAGASTTMTAPTVTPADAASLLLTGHGGGVGTGLTYTITPPPGMTEVSEGDTFVAGQTNTSTEVASLGLASSAATGTKTATASASCNPMGVSVAVKALVFAPGGTNAPADVAPLSILAQDAAAALGVNADVAAASILAEDAVASLGAQADVAAVVVAAQDASVGLAVNADVAAFSVTAQDAVAAVGANADVVAWSILGQDAMVSTTNATNAPADVAVLTVTAQDAVAGVSANADVAAWSTAAQDAVAALGLQAGNAALSITGQDAVASLGVQAGNAAATFAANDAAAALGAQADVAPVTWLAQDATVSTVTQTNAPADVAALSIGAFDATVAVGAQADNAVLAVTANDAAAGLGVQAGNASWSVAGQDATVQIGLQVAAGLAALALTANDAVASIGALADVAAWSVLGLDAEIPIQFTVGALAARAAAASSLTAASSPTATLTASAARGGPG